MTQEQRAIIEKLEKGIETLYFDNREAYDEICANWVALKQSLSHLPELGVKGMRWVKAEKLMNENNILSLADGKIWRTIDNGRVYNSSDITGFNNSRTVVFIQGINDELEIPLSLVEYLEEQ